MTTSIMTAIVGAIICILGVMNMRGNISSLHSYHRHRVSPEDVKPFGRLVGIGNIVCGASVIVYSPFMLATELLSAPVFAIVGSVILIIGLAVGLAISFKAMIKYNGGIF